jgi:predicted membrane-bound mannosyltransferase
MVNHMAAVLLARVQTADRHQHLTDEEQLSSTAAAELPIEYRGDRISAKDEGPGDFNRVARPIGTLIQRIIGRKTVIGR